MRIEIVSVGDELLTGATVNSNAAIIAERLTQLGHEVRWISTVGDDEEALIEAFEHAFGRARIVVVTGGLGPTHDDITKNAVSRYFHSRIVFNAGVFADVEDRLKQWGRGMSDVNREQAMVPEKAEVLANDIGTAPGLFFRKKDRFFFILPGVPREMTEMLEKTVVPRLAAMGGDLIVRSRFLRTFGIPESDLYERIQEFPKRFSDIRLAFLPQVSGVALRLTVSGVSDEACMKMLLQGEAMIRERAGSFIYGEGDVSLEEVVADLLLKRKLTVAVAESCTGGLVSHKLTNVPGSSTYFNRGIVAYSNEAKIEILGVPEKKIRNHGAVSPETAMAMAEGVRMISRTNIGVSTTGIAGPSGGTPEKPVGLVFIGYADDHCTLFEKHLFTRDRRWNKARSALTALDLMRRTLLDR
ncbi:MAG: competence/damage-inducible protein A [bacterium]